MEPRVIWACLVVGAAAALPSTAAGKEAQGKTMTIYVGTYTGSKSRGIYRLTFDAATGALGSPSLVADTPSPSFLAVDPGKRYLYAVNETGSTDNQESGSVSAFAVEPNRPRLRPLNRQLSRGTYPCHVSVDATGRTVMVANYGSGTVASFKVQADGSLGPAVTVDQHKGSGPNQARQEGPHAHAVYPDPSNRHALAADLGTDEVVVYALDPAAGTLKPQAVGSARMAPGSGPRHIAFSPDGKRAYVINEMLSTVTPCAYDAAKGVLKAGAAVSTLPAGFTGNNTTAEIAVHPSGRFVYGSNRGHDSIAVLSVDRKTGDLKLVDTTPTGGKNPRSFAIDPTGAYLLAANQDSDSLVLFRIDPATGKLTPTGATAHVGVPVCVVFVP